MKISKRELQQICDIARANFRDFSPSTGELTYDEFLGKCYLDAVSKVLKIDVEFPDRKPVEPVDE